MCRVRHNCCAYMLILLVCIDVSTCAGSDVIAVNTCLMLILIIVEYAASNGPVASLLRQEAGARGLRQALEA